MIDDRLADCLQQARDCADDHGILDEASAFALLRRAYGNGYIDAHAEMPTDVSDRAAMLDAWSMSASASRALAGSLANRLADRRRID